MKILLDECVPWPVHKVFVGHECTSVQRHGWGGLKNGDLIKMAETEFDLFVTSDQNLRYQQNLASRQITILELSTNDLRRLLAAKSEIEAVITTINPGEFASLVID